MARFCLATGFTPETYYGLTLRERDAFVRELNKRR